MGNPELMKLLISKGCNLNAFDWRGMFALHHCFFGYQGQYITSSVTLECVQVLVEAGADMNTPSTDGWTALNLAVGRRLKQVIKYLLLQNCDPGRKGMSVVGEPEKRVPLYTAVLNKDMQTMKMLLLAGSSCCGSSDIKKTLKEASADQAEFDAIWALLCQPRSFKESCRVAVRDKLRECDSSGGTRFPQRVESLEIPRALKDFVLLKELEDM
nr:hypothetical protein BaRGS_025556 [Batillaria attramentaria]